MPTIGLSMLCMIEVSFAEVLVAFWGWLDIGFWAIWTEPKLLDISIEIVLLENFNDPKFSSLSFLISKLIEFYVFLSIMSKYTSSNQNLNNYHHNHLNCLANFSLWL